MTDRYDDYQRSSQGGRGERIDDRREFGRDQFDYQNRGRGNWENEQERFFRGSRYPEYYATQWGDRERDWTRNPDWQRPQTEWGRERMGHEGPYAMGPMDFSPGYRSGEFNARYRGYGGYTGFGASPSQSYAGGMGAYGQEWGRFTGRGPKGFQRSDDRIREDVCERLTEHPEVDATDIEVKVSNGEVTLSGTIEDRQTKRMAEQVAENVFGVKDVHNQVRVREMTGAQSGSNLSKSEKEAAVGSRR